MVKTSWVAAPGVMVIVVEVALVSDGALKPRVRSPIVPVIRRLVNVAKKTQTSRFRGPKTLVKDLRVGDRFLFDHMRMKVLGVDRRGAWIDFEHAVEVVDISYTINFRLGSTIEEMQRPPRRRSENPR